MKWEEYIKYDATGLTDLVREGEVSKEELLDCSHELIQRLNPTLNAVVEVYTPPLEAQANSPFFSGVPFLLKDMGAHAKNELVEFGSRLGKGIRFPHDTILMEKFRNAGLHAVGRTAAPEFGFCATTESLMHGATRNPWNLARMPGGSSGGSAAAVAAGITPLAHANDGGGSIRLPAACCGLIGLKPTRGRVSPGPDVGESLSGFATEFAVTRSVRDTATLLDAVHGPSPGDPYSIAPPKTSYSDAITRPAKNLRIAFSTHAWSGGNIDSELKAAVEKTAKDCAEMGHEVCEASPTFDWSSFMDATITIWTANTAANASSVANATGRSISEQYLEATTLSCVQHGLDLRAVDLLRALAISHRITREVANFFDDYDLLITPTASKPALLLGELCANDPQLDAVSWSELTFNYAPFTPLFNMTGQPAISLPLHQSDLGLPLGMQIATGFGREDILLQIAHAFEKTHPWPQTAPIANRNYEAKLTETSIRNE